MGIYAFSLTGDNNPLLGLTSPYHTLVSIFFAVLALVDATQMSRYRLAGWLRVWYAIDTITR